MRFLLVVSLLVASVASAQARAPAPAVAPSTRPTNAALRRAFEHNVDTLVEVSGGRRTGAGVVVGSGGQVVTVVDHVTLETATVHTGERNRQAKVLAADARLKVAVVEATLDAGEQLRAPAVHAEAPLVRGGWLVGITRTRRGNARAVPVTGRIVAGRSSSRPFIVTDLPLPPGSPLFDPQGRLVAVVVERVGRIGSRAVPISVVQTHLANARAQRAAEASR